MRIANIIIDNRGQTVPDGSFHRVRIWLTGNATHKVTALCSNKPIRTFIRQNIVDQANYAICGRCARIMVAERQQVIVDSRKEMAT